jgi:hypothetical protein
MRRSRLRLVAGAVIVLAPLAPLSAHAFCRTTTVPLAPDFQPTASQCWNQGLPLYWKNACVGYSLQREASRYVSLQQAEDGIAAAFTRWTSTSCPTSGTGPSRVSVDVRDLGPVDCDVVQYNTDYANQHVILFRDNEWPHNDVNNTLALTTVTFNPDTGEIYDADMEINTYQQKPTLQDPIPPDGYDFASIVTHETGHFLGLAHSGDSHATMFAHYQPGSTAMRSLTNDDIQGICTIYRPDGKRAIAGNQVVAEDACDPTPRHGFTTQCDPPQKKTGCGAGNVTGAPAGDGKLALGMGVGLALLLARRRKST